MLRKGTISIAIFAALGSALALAHSRLDHAVRPGMGYATKADFDRAFANFEGGLKVGAGSTITERELLRVAGTMHFIPGLPVQKLDIVKTKVVADGALSSLLAVDPTLRPSNVDTAANFITLLSPSITAGKTQISGNQSEDVRSPSLN